MAAKLKKRLSKNENKLLKFDILELKDVLCSICQSILIEPVSLPCFHAFCLSCFNGSVQNNALCCPLCRLRIGSWLRTATKQKSLVNDELWKFIQSKFSHAVATKIDGEEIDLPPEKPILRLSIPGEIRREYEAELSRLRDERLQLEEKHLEETELLIKKIQDEEEEAHRKYLEALKKDEIIALQMQKELAKRSAPSNISMRSSNNSTKPRLKDTTIKGFLSKTKPRTMIDTVKDYAILTDDISSMDSSIPSTTREANEPSPEMVPRYGKLIKSLIEKKNKLLPGLWNKENGEKIKEKKVETKIVCKKGVEIDNKSKIKHKNGIPSLLVSLPLPCNGILQHKAVENRKGADSVDSMRQELCYFKPIEQVVETSANKDLPLRIPGVRPAPSLASPVYESTVTRSQYLDSLCSLRHNSLADKFPSAFVIAMKMLHVMDEESSTKCGTKIYTKVKKQKSISPAIVPSISIKKNSNRNKQTAKNKTTKETNLRRTRSMGSITKSENETTPKKAKVKQRKVVSEKKPRLRSDSKKISVKDESPPLFTETLNNNRVNLAVKNLSSPLKNCDVKHILHEQLRIEKIIEQEKIDYELARKLEEEWNSQRPRRAAVKRQMTLTYPLKPAKKLKV